MGLWLKFVVIAQQYRRIRQNFTSKQFFIAIPLVAACLRNYASLVYSKVVIIMKQNEKHHSHIFFFQSFLYVLASVLVSFILSHIPFIHTLIAQLREYGYIGAFLGGMMFTSVFTVAPGALLLIILSQTHTIFSLSIIGGIGALCADYIIASLLASKANDDIKFLSKKDGIMKMIALLRHSRYRFLATIIGAMIVISPLPDELGLSLMGFSNMHRLSFLLITFVLNAAGIYILLSIAGQR
jgi:hypothetical protein